MRFCPLCAAENPDDSGLCVQCGKRLPAPKQLSKPIHDAAPAELAMPKPILPSRPAGLAPKRPLRERALPEVAGASTQLALQGLDAKAAKPDPKAPAAAAVQAGTLLGMMPPDVKSGNPFPNPLPPTVPALRLEKKPEPMPIA